MILGDFLEMAGLQDDAKKFILPAVLFQYGHPKSCKFISGACFDSPNLISLTFISPNRVSPNIILPNRGSPNLVLPNIVSPNLFSALNIEQHRFCAAWKETAWVRVRDRNGGMGLGLG
jgi:hypothetical protein